MSQVPNAHSAEPIPDAARAEVERLLQTGDLFRYTADADAPVALLEAEFAEMLGSTYALAVSSCSAALFLSLKALDLPRDARVLIPGFTFAAVPSSVIHADCLPVLCEVGDNYRIDLKDFADKLQDNISAVIISHMRARCPKPLLRGTRTSAGHGASAAGRITEARQRNEGFPKERMGVSSRISRAGAQAARRKTHARTCTRAHTHTHTNAHVLT